MTTDKKMAKRNPQLSTLNYKLFTEAKKYLVGGVNSPVRAFKAVGGIPRFITRGKGSKIYDVDGREYIDYVCSWGPLILGHAHPYVLKEVNKVLNKGTSFGAPTILETELAKKICEAFPSIELLRLVNSGTEAVMSAIRVARAYASSKRPSATKIIKFAGCYHGHVDHLLVAAGSGATTLGSPDSLGVPKDFAAHTIVLPFNDIKTVEKTIKKFYQQIAAIIVEPIAGNMGLVLPKEDFLHGLRNLANRYRIVLIFDEIITGFRVAYGGAQEFYGIKADLTCLGKIIGGGFPVGAYGGKKEIMQLIVPLGGVYQAGTLSGNPVAVTAGLATLDILSPRSEGLSGFRGKENCYKLLSERTKILCEGLKDNAKRIGMKVSLNRIGSMFTLFFTDKEVVDYETARMADTKLYGQYFNFMLAQENYPPGVYLPPSQFETNFVSLAHSEKDIEKTIKKNYYALKRLQRLF